MAPADGPSRQTPCEARRAWRSCPRSSHRRSGATAITVLQGSKPLGAHRIVLGVEGETNHLLSLTLEFPAARAAWEEAKTLRPVGPAPARVARFGSASAPHCAYSAGSAARPWEASELLLQVDALGCHSTAADHPARAGSSCASERGEHPGHGHGTDDQVLPPRQAAGSGRLRAGTRRCHRWPCCSNKTGEVRPHAPVQNGPIRIAIPAIMRHPECGNWSWPQPEPQFADGPTAFALGGRRPGVGCGPGIGRALRWLNWAAGPPA